MQIFREQDFANECTPGNTSIQPCGVVERDLDDTKNKLYSLSGSAPSQICDLRQVTPLCLHYPYM